MPTAEQLNESVRYGFVILIVFMFIHIIFMGISMETSMSHTGIFGGVFVAGMLSYFALNR